MKKFLLSIAAMLCAFTANAQDVYVVGTVNNWTLTDPTYKMTTVTDGSEYTFDFGDTELVGENIKFTDATAADWSDATINLGKGEEDMTEGTITLGTVSAGNLTVASKYSSATNVKVTIKKTTTEEGDTWTLTATGTFVEGQAAVPTLYLRGGMNGWGSDDEWAFAHEDGSNTWTQTQAVTVADWNAQGFKVADAKWGTYNFGASDPELTVGEDYALNNGSNDNIYFAEDTEDDTYTFTVTKDGDDWTLMVTSSTGIDAVTGQATQKVVAKYNLAGQRTNAANGVVIENGVKVVK